ncbi:MAG: ATP-binding protein [Tenacibaculum sp.]|nr:ATP-binding protein [Tenacibaculum sp.]
MEKIPKQEKSRIIKVVLFGVESTGKTTLSKQLAEHYETEWVPEYARDYLQKKWDKEHKICEKEDVIPIAIGQMTQENKLSKTANKVLICDTNLLQTKVYSEYYYNGFVEPELEEVALQNTYDIYLLTYIDTPWEKDDLRDKPNKREELFYVFEKTLIKYNKPYVVLKGDKNNRLKKAIEVIDKLLQQ